VPAHQLVPASEYIGTAFTTNWLDTPVYFQVRKRVSPLTVTLYRPNVVATGTWGYAYPGTGFVAWTPNIYSYEMGMLLEVTSGVTSTTGASYRTLGNWIVVSEL
jgi:hypothetical protein